MVRAEQYLNDLVQRDLLRIGPAGKSVSFQKFLVRDAIYDSMLTPQRIGAALKQVAEAIETKHADYPEEAADQLAYHWARTDNPENAIRYLAQTGEAALRIYALEEAESSFNQALDLINSTSGFADDELVADIVLNFARVLYFNAEFFTLAALAG